jgi:sulfite reductase alpha subunit-like flavoprotein
MENYEIAILYGSQTGTAKFAAEELERELLRYGYLTSLKSLDEYNFINLPEENFVIFIVATTGYGEPPVNMKNFWNFLMRKDLPDGSLSNLNYTIFGLGDKSYEKFNSITILLNKRLTNLGAQLIHPVGLGDEQQDFGYETEFDPWLLSLTQGLNDMFGNTLLYNELPYIPMYETTVLTDSFVEGVEDIFTIDGLYKGTIKALDKITSDDSIRQVFHLELSDETNIPLNYTHGDVAVVYPRNQWKDVETLLEVFKLDRNSLVEIKCMKEGMKSPFPRVIKAGELLQKYVNINAIPNRYFCKIASKFTKNEVHREKLELFAIKTAVYL